MKNLLSTICLSIVLPASLAAQGLKDYLLVPGERKTYEFAADKAMSMDMGFTIQVTGSPGQSGTTTLTRTKCMNFMGIGSTERYRLSANGQELWHISTTYNQKGTPPHSRTYCAAKMPPLTGDTLRWSAIVLPGKESARQFYAVYDRNNGTVIIGEMRVDLAGNVFLVTEQEYERGKGLMVTRTKGSADSYFKPEATLRRSGVAPTPEDRKRQQDNFKLLSYYITSKADGNQYTTAFLYRAYQAGGLRMYSISDVAHYTANLDTEEAARKALFRALYNTGSPEQYLGSMGVPASLIDQLMPLINLEGSR